MSEPIATKKAATKTAKKKAKTKTAAKTAAKKTAKRTTKRAAVTKVHLTVDALMTPNPLSCRPEADLGEAAVRLWEGDCGALPVLGPDREVVGIVTDRDICMALALSGARGRERSVGDVMSSPVVRCRPEETVSDALAAMAENRVRRLPVTDAEGRLAGMISLTDLVRAKTPAIAEKELLGALRAVVEPHEKTE
jgi:CBS domain-containing protein